MTEDDVLLLYSTPGLRKAEMTRAAKRDHLDGLKVDRDDRDKILGQLFGHTDTELFIADQVRG